MTPKNRIHFLPGGLVAVQLTKGYATVIDLADLPRVAAHRWCVQIAKCGKAYAVSQVQRNNKVTRLHMHRMILELPAGVMTDHRNGDSLDNRRCNLRPATREQNNQNRRLQRNNRSGFKGVVLKHGRYHAQIMAHGVKERLGAFPTADAASAAYDKAARRLHGEFAAPNESIH